MKKIDKKKLLFLFPIISLIYNLVWYAQLPDQLPMQFSLSGEATWTLPKMLGIFTLPAFSIVLLLSQWKKASTGYLILLSVVMLLVNVAVITFIVMTN